jgi:glycerol-3-phosphate acyltransferase PlsX
LEQAAGDSSEIIALDAMGGDRGPSVNVEGALEAVRADAARVVLVGDEQVLRAELERLGAATLEGAGITIRHAPEVIEMDEKPAQAVRKKKGSSMRVACDLVKAGEAAAAVSAGNSGAMMAVALFVFGRIDGVMRPCIATAYPSRATEGFGVLVDAGANTECDPAHLLQFGIMGAIYLADAYGLERPRVGVMANGTEDTKGTELTRETVRLLRETDFEVVGHVEGGMMLSGECHVVVTDGFTGNVMLKTGEAVARFVGEELVGAIRGGGFFTKLGGMLVKRAMKGVAGKLDPREFGAAPLLGLARPAFIAHGSSDAHAIRQAIEVARRHTRQDIAADIREALARYSPLLEAAPAKQA